jgi:opacity protein-like surface antigen
MSRCPRAAIAAAVAALIAGPSAYAQESLPSHTTSGALRPLTAGDRYLEFNAGFSWFSPRGGGWGLITGRRVYLTGIRTEWILDDEGMVGWAYGVEWNPLAVVERTQPGEVFTCYDSGAGRICERDRSAHVAFGTGLSPFGLKAYVNQHGRTRFFANASAGGIAFTHDVPVDNSRKLNYMCEYGGGLEFARADGRAITLGFRFHHISNGASGQVNPGLDANVIYVGVRRLR